ncbi:MAG: TetR/AcrR family transcriptional regulator [Thermoleophilaceae bacterium]
MALIGEPAYKRLHVDERRRRLLELGGRLFTAHAYDELSMSAIAREAGISKALLYHYFPSKSEYFRATVSAAAEELAALTEPDPDLAPLERLTASLDAFLTWIEENDEPYAKLMQSATGASEVRDLVVDVRRRTGARLLEAIAPEGPTPAVRTAVEGWLWFMDGACVDWLAHRDMTREELRNLLLGTLLGTLTAAGARLPL